MLLLLLAACSNLKDTDSGDADTDTDVDTGPAATDAVGDCLAAEKLTAATPVTLTTLHEGDMPGTSDDWTAPSAVSILSDAEAWSTFRAETGLALADDDFATNRVAVVTGYRLETCGFGFVGASGWAMPDGATTYVEALFRIDGSAPCEAACSALGSRMVVLQVPATGGAIACRRTETWCL